MTFFQALHDFFFTNRTPDTVLKKRPIIDPDYLHELDLNDKGLWAAGFSEDIEVLQEELAIIRPEDLTNRLSELQSRIGKFSLSPFYFTLRMKELGQAFIDTKDDIESFAAKYHVFKKANNTFLQLLKNTSFMEQCLEGELIQLQAVFAGKRMLFFDEDCLRPVFYLKEWVSPHLYQVALGQIKKMLHDYQVKTRFGEDFYVHLEQMLDAELGENQYRVKNAPNKLPISTLEHLQEEATALVAEVSLPKISFLDFLIKLGSAPIKTPRIFWVYYLLLTANVVGALAPANPYKSVGRISDKPATKNGRSKRFTEITNPFQVSQASGATPAVTFSGSSNFFDFWIDQGGSFGTGLVMNLNGTTLSSIPVTTQAINATTASAGFNYPTIAAWTTKVSATSYTLSAVTINGASVSAPVVLLSGLTSPRAYLSPHISSTGYFAAVGEINDGAGTGIQLGHFNTSLATICQTRANSVTTGNQLLPTTDVSTLGTLVAWVNEIGSGSRVGNIQAALYNMNCGITAQRALDTSNQYLTLPFVSVQTTGAFFAAIWHMNDVSTSTSATYAGLFNTFLLVAQGSRVTLDSAGNTNGNPPLIVPASGGGLFIWQLCGAGGGANYAQFFATPSLTSLTLLGTRFNLGSVNICGTIAGALSFDANNMLISWTNGIGATPFVFATGVEVGFTAENVDTVNTYSPNTPLTMFNSLNLVLPTYSQANFPPRNATVTFRFSDTAAGSYRFVDSSGISVSGTNNPFVASGLLANLNAAFSSGVIYDPTPGYGNVFQVDVQVVDGVGLAPVLTGTWTMNSDATGSTTAAISTTNAASVTASTAATVTSSLSAATVTTTQAAAAGQLTATNFATTQAIATASANSATATTTEAASTSQIAATSLGTTSTRAQTTSQLLASSLATTLGSATSTASRAATSTTQAATTSQTAATALSTSVAASTGNNTRNGSSSAAAIAGGTVAGVVFVAVGGAVTFFGIRRCRKNQEIEGNRRTTKYRMFADDILSELNLVEFGDFDDGKGAEFAQIIGCIAECLDSPVNGVSVSVNQKTPEEIKILAKQVAESITRHITIQKINWGVHQTLDLNQLREEHRNIAQEAFGNIQSTKRELLSA